MEYMIEIDKEIDRHDNDTEGACFPSNKQFFINPEWD